MKINVNGHDLSGVIVYLFRQQDIVLISDHSLDIMVFISTKRIRVQLDERIL